MLSHYVYSCPLIQTSTQINEAHVVYHSITTCDQNTLCHALHGPGLFTTHQVLLRDQLVKLHHLLCKYRVCCAHEHAPVALLLAMATSWPQEDPQRSADVNARVHGY